MKSIFAVVATENSSAIATAIGRHYPEDHLLVGPGQWLVADEATTLAVAEKLGVGAKDFTSGSGLVLAVSGYYGRKPPGVWEWIKNKWEGPKNG